MKEEIVEVDDSQLSKISKLANQQLELEHEIALIEEQLKMLKQEHKQVSQTDIPEAMAEVGMSEFKLQDGDKVTVQPYYSASIPKDRINEALDWLRDNNHEDLIKNTVSVDFGRGEDDRADTLRESLQSTGLSYTDKTGVHSSTLRAFVREQVEAGKSLPLDLLGVFIGQKTTIKKG